MGGVPHFDIRYLGADSVTADTSDARPSSRGRKTDNTFGNKSRVVNNKDAGFFNRSTVVALSAALVSFDPVVHLPCWSARAFCDHLVEDSWPVTLQPDDTSGTLLLS